MKLVPQVIDGMFEVLPTIHEDERGLFARVFDAGMLADAGIHHDWPQWSTSWNRHRGTLRGMHFQREPATEGKFIRCTSGRAFDVTVDLRRHSPGYRRWVAVELCAIRRNAVYIPPGCAHGFLTLVDGTELSYAISAAFQPELADGVRWNDPAIGIEWPFPPERINDRDATWLDLKD